MKLTVTRCNVFYVLVLAAMIGQGSSPAHAAAPERGADSPTRLLRYADISMDKVVFAYAGDLWVSDRAGGAARRLTSHVGDGAFRNSLRTEVDRLHRRVRRQSGRVRHPGGRRRAEASDLPSLERPGSRLDPRRHQRPVPLRPVCRPTAPLQAAVPRHTCRRHAEAARGSARRPHELFARRQQDRVPGDVPGVSHLETLSGRLESPDRDLRPEEQHLRGAAESRRHGPLPHVARQRDLLHQRSRRRDESVQLRLVKRKS